MLKWGEEELKKKTFPRDDYKELLELVVVGLGGKVEDFVFKLPGPDHHARWMAKGLYNSKMKLLSKVFKLSAEEQRQVDQLSEFVWLFYAKLWFTTPLPCSAARHDLNFMSSILEYRSVNPKLCYEVLRSAYRHLHPLLKGGYTGHEKTYSGDVDISPGLAETKRNQQFLEKSVLPIFLGSSRFFLNYH